MCKTGMRVGDCSADGGLDGCFVAPRPVTAVRARLLQHLKDNRDVVTEAGYATLFGTGFVLGFGLTLLLTRRPLVSLAAGVVLGGGLAEAVLESERLDYEEYLREADRATDIMLRVIGEPDRMTGTIIGDVPVF